MKDYEGFLKRYKGGNKKNKIFGFIKTKKSCINEMFFLYCIDKYYTKHVAGGPIYFFNDYIHDKKWIPASWIEKAIIEAQEFWNKRG